MPLPKTRLADLVRQSTRSWRAGMPNAEAAALREVEEFGDDPGNLRMFCHVPAELPAGAPLVVVLHGCKQNAAGYVRGTGWATLADRHGFAVLAPEQRPGNNAGGCLNWFEPADQTRGSGEAASIRAMVGQLVAAHRLDAKRIFVTGLSAGGAMATVMLATYPEVFAGGAIVAGVPYGVAGSVPEAFEAMRGDRGRSGAELAARIRAASPHRGPWPRLAIWHGDADYTVDVANAESLVAQWSALHGLDGAPELARPNPRQVRRQWRGRAGTILLEANIVTGLGHGVPIAAGDGPGRCGEAAPFILETGISSSEAIAAFFGIAPAVAAGAGVTIDEAGHAQPETDASESAEPGWGAAYAQDVIRRALAAAGLTKR